MTKPLPQAKLAELQPVPTIGSLFATGVLGAGDETAMAEIASLKNAFARWVQTPAGWHSENTGMGGGGGSKPVPRPLGNGPAWRRYLGWRKRWSQYAVGPSPSLPWGLTVASMVTNLITEPTGFREMATVTGMSATTVVSLFVRALRDYGSEITLARNQFWSEWHAAPRKEAIERRRAKWRDRQNRRRKKLSRGNQRQIQKVG